MSTRSSRPPSRKQESELQLALRHLRGAFLGVALVSAMSNILMLTGALYMLQIYDRVLPSRHVPTLIALTVLAAALFVALGLFDVIRSRILIRMASRLDETLSERVFGAIVRMPVKIGAKNDGLQPSRDLDTIRSFLSGSGPIALFDLPWLPLYIAICFAFHFWIGITALIGAIILVIVTVMTEHLTREPTKTVSDLAKSRIGLLDASRHNAETILSMGMARRLTGKWNALNQRYLLAQQRANDVGGGFGAVSKVLRLMLQAAVLAVGAYLVIGQQATAGIIIAGAILSARALAPVDLAIANWKGFVAARQGWARLNSVLQMIPESTDPMPLQAPHQRLVLENASVCPAGSAKFVVQDASFALNAGDGLGIIGPSASGKSSLARLIVGVWPAARGRVRLDGAALSQWPAELLGASVGYVPQHVELIEGTVADNIARFEPNADPGLVIEAAVTAGVHELIVNLPDGYETQVGEHGAMLSAGQAQRIALARALYRDPFLVVLDEPNSNLDAEGEEALTQAILAVRRRNGIAVVIAHRPSAIAAVDLLLVMEGGRMKAFGPKDDVLAKVLARPITSRTLKAVPDTRDAS